MPAFDVPGFGSHILRRERLGVAPKIVLLWLLRGYKRALSPLFLPSCRYVPTCSEYAAEALERYGAVRGSMMALGRLLRCHPVVRGGFDPVPNGDASVQDEIEIFPRTRACGATRAAAARAVAVPDRICSHTTH
jgi:putative membrane protein insertion efficiency factor